MGDFNINIHDEKFSIKPSVTYDNPLDIIEDNRDSVSPSPSPEIFNDVLYHPETSNHFKRGTTSRPKTFSSPLTFFSKTNMRTQSPSLSSSQSATFPPSPSSLPSSSSPASFSQEEFLTGDPILDEFQTNFRTVDKEVFPETSSSRKSSSNFAPKV